jgi:hypothetical protein
MIKVIVAGGRDFSNEILLTESCDRLLVGPDFEIVSGTARGADRMGEFYAIDRNFQIQRFPPDWDTHGNRAGYLRNQEMAKYADMLIAFWDGQSRGTKHMIDIATTNGLTVHVIKY